MPALDVYIHTVQTPSVSHSTVNFSVVRRDLEDSRDYANHRLAGQQPTRGINQ